MPLSLAAVLSRISGVDSSCERAMPSSIEPLESLLKTLPTVPTEWRYHIRYSFPCTRGAGDNRGTVRAGPLTSLHQNHGLGLQSDKYCCAGMPNRSLALHYPFEYFWDVGRKILRAQEPKYPVRVPDLLGVAKPTTHGATERSTLHSS